MNKSSHSYPTGPKGAIQSKLTGSLEKNNQKEGREGGHAEKFPGPAKGRLSGNPTSNGKIKRS